MQVITNHTAGKIVAMTGQAVARGAGGKLRMVTVGDWVAHDEVIVTAQNGSVQLSFDDAPRRSAELTPHVGASTSLASAGAPRLADLTDTGDAGWGAALRVDALNEALTEAPSPYATSPLATPAAAETSAAANMRSAFPRGGSDHLAPRADAARLATAEDTALPISLTGRDAEGSLAAVWVVKVPTGGVLYKADGVPIADRTELTPAEAQTLVFRPAPDFHGNPGPLQFMVIDQHGRPSDVATVGITVQAVNDAPIPGMVPLGPDDVAIADASPNHLPGTPDYRYATTADTAVAGRVNATDVDLDPMRFSTSTEPAHGSVAVAADGSFVYTPGSAYAGADRFVVQVDDGRGGAANSTVFIDVAPATAGPQGVFAWSLAEAAPPLASAFTGAPVDAAEALDLNSLLQGPGRLEPAHGLDLFPAGPASWATDPGLDWAQRLVGASLWHE